jgi:hypothetical protein
MYIDTVTHGGGGGCVWLPGGHWGGSWCSFSSFDGEWTSVSLIWRPPSISFLSSRDFCYCYCRRNTGVYLVGFPMWILPIASLGCHLTCSSEPFISYKWVVRANLIKFMVFFLWDYNIFGGGGTGVWKSESCANEAGALPCEPHYFLNRVFPLCLDQPKPLSSYYASQISWDDRHATPLLAIGWDGVLWTFCPGWPLTMILPIFVSLVVGL